MYERGLGVEQDYAEVITWYRRAADQGDAVSQFNLGFAYARGLGV
jgi:TPR repeat protein